MRSCYSYLLCWRPTLQGRPMTLCFPLNASEESVACDSSFSFSLVDRWRIHPCRPTRCPNFYVFSCEKPHITFTFNTFCRESCSFESAFDQFFLVFSRFLSQSEKAKEHVLSTMRVATCVPPNNENTGTIKMLETQRFFNTHNNTSASQRSSVALQYGYINRKSIRYNGIKLTKSMKTKTTTA